MSPMGLFAFIASILRSLLSAIGTWLRRLICWIIQAGPKPRHVAFIMDGNRRFAEFRCMKIQDGHREGYVKLVDALDWCLDLGITTVSVYAFSVENFKRSRAEVDDLMALAEDKLAKILTDRHVVDKHGVQVRVIGELELLPPAVKEAAANVMHATRGNSRGVLNICFSYTSQHEIASAVERARRGIAAGALKPEDVDARLVSHLMHTAECPPVDLLVRTSGETRFSDFLLWQSGSALLEFTSVLWPQMSFYDLLKAILRFQWAHKHMESMHLPQDKTTPAPTSCGCCAHRTLGGTRDEGNGANASECALSGGKARNDECSCKSSSNSSSGRKFEHDDRPEAESSGAGFGRVGNHERVSLFLRECEGAHWEWVAEHMSSLPPASGSGA